MLNPEMSGGTTYDLPVRQTLTYGARAFGRAVYRLTPGPVLVIIAAGSAWTSARRTRGVAMKLRALHGSTGR